MVAAGVGVDLGSSAELAHHHHQGGLEQTRAPRDRSTKRRSPLSSGGASVFLIVGKFWAWVSQPSWPVPRSLTVTNETPASTSRRASRHDWPNGRPAVLVADRLGLVADLERRLGGGRGQERVRPLGELVAAGRQRRAGDVVGEVVERLDHVAAAEQPLERQAVGRSQVRGRGSPAGWGRRETANGS